MNYFDFYVVKDQVVEIHWIAYAKMDLTIKIFVDKSVLIFVDKPAFTFIVLNM